MLLGPLLPAAPTAASELAQMKGKPTNQASKRDNGSAAVLAGNVLLANIYVSDARSAWTSPDRREVRRRLAAAARFIADQAERYGRRVVFTQIDVDVAHKGEVSTSLAADPGWTQQVLANAGTGPTADLLGRLTERHGAEHVLFVLHVNKAGRSYNLTYSDGIHSEYWAERVVCFTRYDNQWPTTAASYVHEILHAFGAGELYFPFDVNNTREQLAGRVFSDDVMYRVDYQLRRLEIGDYTAYRIGWRDTLQQEYRVFEDSDERQGPRLRGCP
jgi:hypothetical protein